MISDNMIATSEATSRQSTSKACRINRPSPACIILTLAAVAAIALLQLHLHMIPGCNQHVNYPQTRARAQAPRHISAPFTFSEVFGDSDNNSAIRPKLTTPPPQSTWLLPAFTAKQNTTNQSRFIDSIPRIINKIYYQKSDGFQAPQLMKGNLKKAHESWHEMNPGYSIRYFDLEQSREYMKAYFHPVFLRAFDCIEAFAGKSDFFRMVLLYRQGGWHSDWKQQCLRFGILDEISENHTGFFATHDMGNGHSTKHKCVQNALVGAMPQHPIIAESLKLTLSNVQTSYYGATPLDTSVCVLAQAIKLYQKTTGSRDEKLLLGDFLKHDLAFHWRGEKIVQHKCKDCGMSQEWKNGNNYITLHKKKEYYCQDASTIFHR